MVLKVTVQKSTAILWKAIFNQMIKYQLPHSRFDQIDIYLKGKLSANLIDAGT